MRRISITILLLLAVIHSSSFAGGSFFYVTITGSKTKFKADMPPGYEPLSGHTSDIVAQAFSYELKYAANPGTGLASGKRQHSPITITKEWGASSPQLFNALVTNETLSKVVLTFVANDPLTGAEKDYYTITLTNARIIDIRSFKDLTFQGESVTRELENISFTFEKIEVEHKGAGTLGSDNWRQ